MGRCAAKKRKNRHQSSASAGSVAVAITVWEQRDPPAGRAVACTALAPGAVPARAPCAQIRPGSSRRSCRVVLRQGPPCVDPHGFSSSARPEAVRLLAFTSSVPNHRNPG